MTQVSPKHDALSSILKFYASVQTFFVSRDFRLNNTDRADLSAHLRHDIGEDDCRPAAPSSLLQQEVTRAMSVDRMLLRSF